MLRFFCPVFLLFAHIVVAQEGFAYGDSILAVVGEKVITAYEVMQASAREEALLPRSLTAQQRSAETVALRRRALSNMIDRELLYLEFQALKAKIPEQIVQERLNQAVLSQAGGDQARFEEMLYKEGMSLQEFKDRLGKNLAIDMLLYDRVNRGITISQQKIADYYEQNKASFSKAAKFHLEAILLRKDGRYQEHLEDTCREIYEKLQGGAAFAELAKEYSEGANAENGGDQGWLSEMNAQLHELVETMQPGELAAKPLDLGSSLYIVRLINREEAKEQMSSEEEEKIRQILSEKEEEERYNKLLRELRLKFSVRRMDGMPGD